MPTEHDPFAPHRTVARSDSPGADEFPADRLARAGVDPEHVERLRDWFDNADPAARHEWREGIRSAPDQAIIGRFTTPEGMDLGDLTKDQLESLLRARQQPTSGNKPDLIHRLTQETPSEPAGAPDGGPGPDDPGENPEGAETADGEAEAPSGDDGPPPNEAPTTAEPVTGVGQPPDPAQQATPQGQPGAPQEPSHEPPVTAPSAPQEPTARRSTGRTGGTGRGH